MNTVGAGCRTPDSDQDRDAPPRRFGRPGGRLPVCDRPPEPFDKDIVAPRALAVHAHRDLGVLQGREKGDGGERAALIRVHDFRPTMPARASLNASTHGSVSSVIESRQATLALKAGLWFRRVRLVMIAPR